jgi:ribosomal protein S25
VGGVKKRTLKQSEKRQAMQAKKNEKQSSKKTVKFAQKKISGLEIPKIEDKELKAELLKMKAITPYTISVKYNITQSIAKQWLKSLVKVKTIEPIASSNNLKVYKFRNQIN